MPDTAANTQGTAPQKFVGLQWRHNELNDVSNHQPHDRLIRLLTRRSKKTSKFRVTGFVWGIHRQSPVAFEFPAQMASDAENVSIWWRHHGKFRARPNDILKLVKWSNLEFSFAYFGHFLSLLQRNAWTDYHQIWETLSWICIEDTEQLSMPWRYAKCAF